MRTTVTIPDDDFAAAERLRRELRTSRSCLYSRAIQELLVRYAERITESMDRVVADAGTEVDELSQRAARQVLEGVEW